MSYLVKCFQISLVFILLLPLLLAEKDDDDYVVGTFETFSLSSSLEELLGLGVAKRTSINAVGEYFFMSGSA